MIKIFSYPQKEDVEKTVNTWLKQNNIRDYFINYSVVVFENEIYHNVVISYNDQVDE